ncbi:hypothetical protein M3Y99_01911800 [Aphelenchoides fujianensis]|nr:hypothetical protein M3Y99_01911800 [Aphelenchoides fujianensis]
MGNDKEQAGASDSLADESEEDEKSSDRADSSTEYDLPIHNARENWTKFPRMGSIHTRCFPLDGRYVYRLRADLFELQILDLVRSSQLYVAKIQDVF